jgi:transcriptional regulator with XRE-family HTH domain
MNIGNAIQLVRTKRKLSQTELAARAGISVSYLSLLERSKRDPALSIIEKITAALGMPIELLFFLGAEGNELGFTALELMNEPAPHQTTLSM